MCIQPFYNEIRSSYCTNHNSSRALKTHELVLAFFEKVFISPYIFLHDLAAIRT